MIVRVADVPSINPTCPNAEPSTTTHFKSYGCLFGGVLPQIGLIFFFSHSCAAGVRHCHCHIVIVTTLSSSHALNIPFVQSWFLSFSPSVAIPLPNDDPWLRRAGRMTVRFDKTVREHTYLGRENHCPVPRSAWGNLPTSAYFFFFFASCGLQTPGTVAAKRSAWDWR